MTAARPEEARYLIFDLFSGMDGLGCALNLLGVSPSDPACRLHVISFETDTAARALLKRSCSPTKVLSDAVDSSGEVGSVLALVESSFSLLKSTLASHPSLQHVLFAGGSPCQGFSRANPSARGVQDPRSSLIWVFHALASAARLFLPAHVSVALLIENVVLPDSARGPIDRLLGLQPQLIDAAILCHASRPRLFWSS